MAGFWGPAWRVHLSFPTALQSNAKPRSAQSEPCSSHVKAAKLVQIPDDFASRMTAGGGDLSRRALEAPALEEFKSGYITKPELRRLLGFGTRYQLDGFLKAHAVFENSTMEDFARSRRPETIGILACAAHYRRYRTYQLSGTNRKHRSASHFVEKVILPSAMQAELTDPDAPPSVRN